MDEGFEQVEHEGQVLNINSDGNAVNESGEVILSKEKLVELNITPISNDNSEQVDVDGVIYILDKEGNAVDSNGVLKYTKDELDKLSETETNSLTEQEYLDAIKAKSGIILTNDKGEEIVYEPTIEGLAQRESDIFNHAKEVGGEERLNKFFDTNPEVKALYEYKMRYGTTEGFGVKTDYKNLQLDYNDVAQLKSIIIAEKMLKGESRVDAEYTANLIEADGKLKEKADISHDILKRNQLTEENNIAKSREESKKKNQEALERQFGITVKNGEVVPLGIEGSYYDLIVEKGILPGIDNVAIPKTGINISRNGKIEKMSREQIFEYFSIASDEYGNSQFEIDMADRLRNPANKIYLGLSFLLNENVTQLVEAATHKQAARVVRKFTTRKDNNPAARGNDKVLRFPL